MQDGHQTSVSTTETGENEQNAGGGGGGGYAVWGNEEARTWTPSEWVWES